MKTIAADDLLLATGGASATDRTTALSTLSSALDELKRNQNQPSSIAQLLPIMMMMRMRG